MKKILPKKVILTGLLVIFSLLTYAQVKVSGTVKDKDGLPIPGASVQIKGTLTGVSTDPDGKYAISVPANSTLSFSFVGFASQDIAIGDKTEINVVLQASANDLSEVVVVGYGAQKKVSLAGAVNTVNTKNIVNRPVTSLTNALQGAVPGVAIKSAPGDVGSDLGSINVRGRGNLGTSEPLFVVDGVIVSAGDFARINSNDVENISVLKDAAAAIYGSRAAYGVILVTTKKRKRCYAYQL